MEKKMTAEEIIDSKYPFPAGKLKDVTLNGVQVKELMESLVKLSPLPDNNGVKEPDGWIQGNKFYANKKEMNPDWKAKPVYFSTPAKVEVSDEQIALDFGCMANEWANDPNFSMKETVIKLRHLLSKK